MRSQELRARTRAAQQVLTRPSVIVITDKEGLILLKLNKDTNAITLAAQRAALLRYRDAVDERIDELDKEVARFAKTKSKSSKKIKVKEG